MSNIINLFFSSLKKNIKKEIVKLQNHFLYSFSALIFILIGVIYIGTGLIEGFQIFLSKWASHIAVGTLYLLVGLIILLLGMVKNK